MHNRHSALRITAIYTLLALILTWPLLRNLTTHVPGDGIDDPSLAWNLWWIKSRLLEQLNFDIFHADWTFFPIQINLAFYTLTPLNGLLSVPLQVASSLILANNLILLSSFVLGALGAYLLAYQELRFFFREARRGADADGHLQWAAFFAGIVYAFASSKLFYVSLGQFNIASSQWIPFCILYLLRMGRATDKPTQLRSALLAALFFGFQAWAELTYASFLMIFIALWLLWHLAIRYSPFTIHHSPSTIHHSPSTIHHSPFIPFLLFSILCLIGLSPFLAAMLPDMRSNGDFFGSGGGFADIFSADLAGYFVPTRLHPWLGSWVATLAFPNNKGQQIYPGYILLTLILVALFRRGRSPHGSFTTAISFWGSNSLLFFLLTLGPNLRWMGHDLPIPGPFAIVSQLPFFSGNRYPSRYAVMLLLCLAILAAVGLVILIERVRLRSLLIGCVSLFFLAEQLAIPLPLSDFRTPALYQRIAETPGDFTLLELPTGWRNGAREIGRRDLVFMMQQWYQTTHGKRRLGGNTSRNPPYKFQYFSEAPLLDDLIALMNGDESYASAEVDAQFPRMVEDAKRDAPAILALLGVRYVMVHVEKSTPQLLRFVEEALPLTLLESWQGNDWSGTPSTLRLYEVSQSAAFTHVDLRSKLGRLYQAEGWSALGGTGSIMSDSADLMLNLPEAGGELSFDLSSSASPLEISLNGVFLDRLTTSEKMTRYQLPIPPGVATALVDHLQLRFLGTPPAASSAQTAAPWQIGNAASHTFPLALRSAGLEVGDFAQIYLAGKEVAKNERGYNLVAIAGDGTLLESVVFDTFGNCPLEPPDESAANAMAAWLSKWPPGTIIAGSVADEASCRLSEDAIVALRQIGVATDLRGRFRWSHVFVGEVGAAVGQAIERTALLQPAEVRLGNGLDGAQHYAAVGEVWFEE